MLAADRAVVRPEGREHVFEPLTQQRGLQRRVVQEPSHRMSQLPVLESSVRIATVPRDLADVRVRCGKLGTVAKPLKAPVIAVHQTRHRRFHKDPAYRWLRQLVRDPVKAHRRNAEAAPSNFNPTTP